MGSDVGLFGTDAVEPDPDADVAARLVLAVAAAAVRAALAFIAATF
jgi:hypothetical protein